MTREDELVRLSSFSRALRVLSYVFRFTFRARSSHAKQIVELELQPGELRSTKKRLMIAAQSHYFAAEYLDLSEGRSVSSKSQLQSLHPFLHQDQLIRVGGRLTASLELSFDEKHPIIIPKEAHFAALLIRHIHQVTLHGGNQLMLRVLRSRSFGSRERKPQLS